MKGGKTLFRNDLVILLHNLINLWYILNYNLNNRATVQLHHISVGCILLAVGNYNCLITFLTVLHCSMTTNVGFRESSASSSFLAISWLGISEYFYSFILSYALYFVCCLFEPKLPSSVQLTTFHHHRSYKQIFHHLPSTSEIRSSTSCTFFSLYD